MDFKIKVLVVDDHSIFRKSLVSLLKNFDELEVVGDCEDGIHVDEFVTKNDTDVILMDYNMKVQGGLETTKQLSVNHPKIKVIGLSSHHEEYVINKLKEAGAVDYMTKDTDFEIMLEKIKNCMSN